MRTLLLFSALAVLLLALTGCRAGAHRLNQNTDGPSQPAAVTAQPQVTSRPGALQPAAADLQPEATQIAPAEAQPTLAGGDAELQDLVGQLEQLDKANQAADPLDDLPQ